MQEIENYNFNGDRALVRVDYNIPMSETLEIVDDIRIIESMPTIQKILDDGGYPILMSHLGRPGGQPNPKFSLKHLVDHLSKVFKTRVCFVDDCVGQQAQYMSRSMNRGEILLLENLRFYQGEIDCEDSFSRQLSLLGDVYVNDAFATSHRNHASITGVTKFIESKMMGLLMKKEIDNANNIINNPQRPFTTILGGSKVSDKIVLIERLIEKADNLLICGGMANTFLKAIGARLGSSKYEDDKLDFISTMVEKAELTNVNLIFPVDYYISNRFHNQSEKRITNSLFIPDGWMGLDIGPFTQEKYRQVIEHTSTILWNGPPGVFEFSNFSEGTRSIAEAVASVTQKGAFSLVGGGDSASAIHLLKMEDSISYISTGGGALLTYIADESIAGLEALL